MSHRKSTQPCRFFRTSRGCREGSNCRFAHDATTPTTASRGGRPTRGGPSTRGSNRPSARSSRPPPGGVCRFFWGTGRCRLGFECQYKHIASDPGLPSNVQPTNGASSMPALLEGGYSKIGNLGSDAFQSPPSVVMQSNEAHNALKRFLRDGYRFSSTSDVYAFLAPLESASGWSGEDSQLLLTTLSDGNGLSRITDVLLWSDVEFNAGTDRTTLSFQRGYFPVIRFLASGFIVKSTMTKCANTLYQTFLDNFDFIKLHLEAAIDDMVNSCSFKDPNAEQERALSGAELFSCLATVLFECMSRFKTAIIDCRVLVEIIDKLRLWSSDWIQGMTSVPPVFQDILCDNPDAKRVVVSHIEKQINRLLAIAEREMAKVDRVHEKHRGTRRVKKGPRHDNDFADIDDIRIAPTHEELACKIPPYLPINVYDAPHHHPQESMERLQDTQFRLLREELTAPLRTSIQCVLDDLHNTKTKTTLSDLRKRNGGRYKGLTENGQDSVLFNLYTNVKFEEVVPDRRGLSVKISFDTPPGRARSQRPNARAQFWESSSGKRLMQGGLIGLVWRERGQITVHLGIIASPAKEIAEFVRNNPDRVAIRVAFFDSSLDVRALDALKFGGKKSTGDMLLVESPVMFEAVRPFLEALRVEPESIPFKEYLVHRPRSFLGKCEVPPPKYARMPGFHYQLAPLFPESSGVTDLKLFPTKQDSISEARTALDNSRLDPSQATAVVDALTREISLIQGPPGTGKSFVGIELLRVLVKTATPILMIAFTNHALDHLLSGVLDAGITSNIVRLGSRSADERVSSYSIEQLEHSNDRSSLLGSITSRNFRNLKDVERQFEQLLAKIKRPYTSSQDVTNFLLDKFPEHGKSIRDPPAWIRELHRQLQIAYQDRWTEVNRNQGRNDPRDDSLYSFWSRHEDIAFLSTPTYEELDPPRESHSEVQSTNMFDLLEQVGSFDDEDDEVCPVGDLPEWQKSFFASGAEVESTSNPSMNSDQADRSGDQGLARSPDPPVEPPRRSNLDVFFEAFDQPVPSIPSLDRPLENLLEDWNLWRMSRTERATLDGYWKQEIRRSKEQLYASEFDRLKQDHDTVLRAYNEGKEEVRRQLLEGVDIVGCTTTGAAKLTSLLRGVGPRIMLVEEAGQVLEAHILGSLVPSIEHMILIGDPLQLRPTLNNYSLSMDSKQGSRLFKFDMSLMERLSSSGFPMSQIDVQRRMRPTISNLIRTTLYPNLVDNDLVTTYPNVRGLAENIFFLDHQNPEAGGIDDGGSRYNDYEVKMIRDLVLYLLKQGCYSKEGDIVVLCAYLGQLAKVRDALQDVVAVVIDERDQDELASREDGNENDDPTPSVEQFRVSKRVRLRTVDNYQGEEAKIVILSLVRNATSRWDAENQNRSTIGFLKSENRINVALSRAKEGLFILGNRALLASKSRMWRSILDQLDQNGWIGSGIPIKCSRHPGYRQYISAPGTLEKVAPEGGCLQPCGDALGCGHQCPLKCHPDDRNHVKSKCRQPCARVCSRQHRCRSDCSKPCPPCQFQYKDVPLPCGHVAPFVPCHQMEKLGTVKCKSKVPIRFDSCKHEALVGCSDDHSSAVCTSPCSKVCSRHHPCRDTCSRDCPPCRFQYPDVLLPCGHVAPVSCYQLDSLDTVRCNSKVARRFDSCEHEALIACSEDPLSVVCTSPCGRSMTCCGSPCKSSCASCQKVNLSYGSIGRVPRENHQQHACQRLLRCAHPCGNPCSANHECSTACKQQCLQRCSHAQCKKYCGNLCSPCLKACEWTCPHHRCPVPCGSVCTRLPCDERCERLLGCGHRCPSVCGETCVDQICPICAPIELRRAVVDPGSQRTLDSLPPRALTIEDLIITLPGCRHIFTVSVLDTACRLKEWYIYDDSLGRWTGLRTPDSRSSAGEIPILPLCPTCRTPITAARYGRVYKAASLAVLERNTIHLTIPSLNSGKVSVRHMAPSQIELGLEEAIFKLDSASIMSIKNVTQLARYNGGRKLLQTAAAGRKGPFPVQSLDPMNKKGPNPSPQIAKIWRAATRPLFDILVRLNKVANTRPLHTTAWDSAYSYLLDQEVNMIGSAGVDPANGSGDQAARAARAQVGQHQPRFHQQLLVEAILLSVHTRLILASLVILLLDHLADKPVTRLELQPWTTYCHFIHETCSEDTFTAAEIAKEGDAHRLQTLSQLYVLRAELEYLHFSYNMASRFGSVAEASGQLLGAIARHKTTTERISHDAIRRHLALLPQDGIWFKENFSTPITRFDAAAVSLERAVKFGTTTYDPSAIDWVRRHIPPSLLTSHSIKDHWRHCFNGHAYTVGPNHGCPECGE